MLRIVKIVMVTRKSLIFWCIISSTRACEITNFVYLIECKKDNCDMKYVGETKRMLKNKLSKIKINRRTL